MGPPRLRAGRRGAKGDGEEAITTTDYNYIRIVHRDLKPANCLVDGYFTVNVADLGSGKRFPFSFETDEPPGTCNSSTLNKDLVLTEKRPTMEGAVSRLKALYAVYKESSGMEEHDVQEEAVVVPEAEAEEDVELVEVDQRFPPKQYGLRMTNTHEKIPLLYTLFLLF
ncbi:hypothetical protein Pelo_1436 [Pelomyxa schiedti]|nr:hypothetical protein Pelo_1436 [Pelomyxa schiedti]